MKKLIKSALALATILFAASCQQENLEPAQSGSTVTFSVEVPGMAATKALGDDANLINDLVYAVYRTEATGLQAALDDWDGTKTALVYQKNPNTQVFSDNYSTTVELELVNNQNYIVLFWAQNSDTWVSGEDFDLTNITYPTSLTPETANSDKYAAFSGVAYLSKNETVKSHSIELTRPFGQINVATVDPVNYDVNVTGSTITIKNAGDSFNVAKQAAADNADVVYTWTGKASASSVVFNDATYEHYVAMNYVFANGNVTVAYDINTEEHGTVTNVGIPEVPVAQNFRTNIIGNLLTSQHEYSVTLDKDWGDLENNIGPDGTKFYNRNVSTADEFIAALNASTNGDIITLQEDINLNEYTVTRSTEAAIEGTFLTIPADLSVTFDLNGHTLSGKTSGTGKNQVLFDVRGNLTVKNGTMTIEHDADKNLGWNYCTEIFYVGFDGTLNVVDATLKNLGGSSMAYCVDLVNAKNTTLNIDDSNVESTYVAVRVFNNSNGMNHVAINNSTIKGSSRAFWVHMYTEADNKGTVKDYTLDLDIFGNGNTYVGSEKRTIEFGFTNQITFDGEGELVTYAIGDDVYDVIKTADALKEAISNGPSTLWVSGNLEGTFDVKRVVAINSVKGQATITGRVNVYTDAHGTSFKNINFDINDYSKVANSFTGANYQYPAIVVINCAAVSFDGCDFKTNINKSVGAINYGNHASNVSDQILTVKDCNFEGDFYAIRTRPFFNITDSHFKSTYPADGLSCVWVWGNGDSSNGSVTFQRNTAESNYVYGALQLTASNYVYQNITFNVKDNVGYSDTYWTNPNRTYKNITFVDGSETFGVPVTSTQSLKAALDEGAKYVDVAAGTYTFPASYIKEGTTINCEEGTVFEGKSSLNIKGATVVGATFKNDGDQAVSGTIYGTFKNCTFEGQETLRWCYTKAGEQTVFENCVVKTSLRGIHFDEMNGDVTFRNCEINGFNAYSGTGSITFEGCTFGHDKSKYNGLNIYSNTSLKNCEFNYVSGNTNFIDMEGTGKTLTIENCTATLDGAAAEISDFVGGSKLSENTVVYK